MSRNSRLAVLMVSTLLAALPVLAGDLEFKAELSGANEVPTPVDTATTGEAKLEVDAMMTAVEFELEIEDAVNILGAAGAHIHCAPAGQNGPVVVFLAGAVPGGFDGKLEIKGTFSASNIINPACGATIADLVDSFVAGRAYVNVHSTQNPGGEVRGQIEED